MPGAMQPMLGIHHIRRDFRGDVSGIRWPWRAQTRSCYSILPQHPPTRLWQLCLLQPGLKTVVLGPQSTDTTENLQPALLIAG